MQLHDWIVPDWSAPSHVHAVSTTRSGGLSQANYLSLNPASHVNDDDHAVTANRLLIQRTLGLASQPHWLNQYHSTRILDLDHKNSDTKADGSTTTRAGVVCAVMTADCLPVLLTDREGQRIAAIHAGWRGLAAGVLEAAVRQFSDDQDILAWLGPAIGPDNFEVGAEVIEQLSTGGVSGTDWYKESTDNRKWLVDLYKLASIRLQNAGVTELSGGGYCTFSDEKRFFSYRRQGDCGRMATLIWIDHQAADGQTTPS